MTTAARNETGFDAPIVVGGTIVGFARIAHGKIVARFGVEAAESHSPETPIAQVQLDAPKLATRPLRAATKAAAFLDAWWEGFEPPAASSRRRRKRT